jgi:hypothetical protein
MWEWIVALDMWELMLDIAWIWELIGGQVEYRG